MRFAQRVTVCRSHRSITLSRMWTLSNGKTNTKTFWEPQKEWSEPHLKKYLKLAFENVICLCTTFSPPAWSKGYYKYLRRKLKFIIFNLTTAASLYLISFLRRPSNTKYLKVLYILCFCLQIKSCFKPTNDTNDSFEKTMDIQWRNESEKVIHNYSSVSLLHFTILSPCAHARLLRSNSGFLALPKPHPSWSD